MSPTVAIIGRGKVGHALAEALSPVAHVAGREPPVRLRADLVILAVRDGQLPEVARAYAGRLEADVVLHVAGAVGPEVLAPLRPLAIGQWHPVLSFVDHEAVLAGAAAVMTGDTSAIAMGRRLCELLQMVPVEPPEGIDLALYHAALALSANGMAALAASAETLLAQAGLPAGQAAEVLGPLLASVASNVRRRGAGTAMSGPVRRGDVATIARHLRRLERTAPEELPTYRASVRAQLTIAERLAEASPEALQSIGTLLGDDAGSVTLKETDEGGEA